MIVQHIHASHADRCVTTQEAFPHVIHTRAGSSAGAAYPNQVPGGSVGAQAPAPMPGQVGSAPNQVLQQITGEAALSASTLLDIVEPHADTSVCSPLQEQSGRRESDHPIIRRAIASVRLCFLAVYE